MGKNIVQRYFEENAQEWVDFGHEKEGYNYPVGKNRNRIVKKILSEFKGIKEVLDIGCGGGNLCVDLAKENYHVKGIDESVEMIKISEKRAAEANEKLNIQFSRMSIHELDADHHKYDAITAMGVIGYLDNDDHLFSLANKKLNKGGLFIVSCRNRLFNLFSTSKYMKKEMLLGDEALIDEVGEINKEIPARYYNDFAGHLNRVVSNLSIISSADNADEEEKIEENVSEETVSNTLNLDDQLFLDSIRQHTPSELEASATGNGFNKIKYYGVHPHLLPAALNDKLPVGVYNDLSSALAVFEDLPISMIWSSVFIGVFIKK